jgi:hypothetical protein
MRAGWLALVSTLVACGSPSVDVDGGMLDGGWPIEPTPPAAPVAAQLAPCPPGWVEQRTEGAPTECRPWADDAPSCPPGTVRWPGAERCEPVGGACPTEPFASATDVTGPVLHVAPGGTGDGSRERPFGTIGDAIARATRGTTILIARGTYDELVAVPAGVRLRGVCATDTVVRSTDTVDPVAVRIEGPDVRVERLSIGGRRVGLLVLAGASMHAEGVIVEGASFFGVGVAEGGRFTARELVVRDVEPRADGLFGRGVEVESGAFVRIERLWVDGAHDVGVFAESPGTEVVITDAVIRETRRASGSRAAVRGAHAQLGASLALERVVVEDGRDIGISAHGADTRITLADVVVRRTRGNETNGRDGVGLLSEVSATVVADRVSIAESRLVGVAVVGGTLEACDVVVRDTEPQVLGDELGVGVSVSHGGHATIERAWLARNHVYAAGAIGGDLTLREVTVEGTRPGRANGVARGLEVAEGGRAVLERVRIMDARDSAVFVFGAGSEVRASDLHVARTESNTVTGFSGAGLSVGFTAQAWVERAHFEDCREATIAVFDPGTRVELRDVRVERTRGRALDGQTGRGIVVQGGQLVGARCRITSSTGLGVGAYYGDSSIVLSDVTIDETSPWWRSSSSSSPRC